MSDLIRKIEVHQSWDGDYEQWAVCIHDGIQWLRIRDDLDVVDAHDMADRLRALFTDELEWLTNPAGFERPDEPVAQPTYDESKPNMHYPPAVRDTIMGTPDADVWNNFSVTEPPVPLD